MENAVGINILRYVELRGMCAYLKRRKTKQNITVDSYSDNTRIWEAYCVYVRLKYMVVGDIGQGR